MGGPLGQRRGWGPESEEDTNARFVKRSGPAVACLMAAHGDIVVSLQQLRERLENHVLDRWLEQKQALDESNQSGQRFVEELARIADSEPLQVEGDPNRNYGPNPKLLEVQQTLHHYGIATTADLEGLSRHIREKAKASTTLKELRARQAPGGKDNGLHWAGVIVVACIFLAAAIHISFIFLAITGLWPIYRGFELRDKLTEQEERLKQVAREIAQETSRLQVLLMANLRAKYVKRLDELSGELQQQAQELCAECDALIDRAGPALWPWSDSRWSSYAPGCVPHSLIRFGAYVVNDSIRRASQRKLPRSPLDFVVPAAVRFPTGPPLYFAGSTDTRVAIECVQGILARILATTPAGKLRLLFFDPVGRGQNAAPFMHLGDHDEKLITSKAWTEPEHIEQRLKDLTEHLENVIQKYLRNQFATIEEYNAQAQEIAEPYRVVVVFDYDVAFTDAAVKRLRSLVENGPRCGIYPIIVAGKPDSRPWPGTVAIITSSNGTFVSEHSGNRSELAREAARSLRIQVGEVYEGVVRFLRARLAVVDLGPYGTGTVHISQITGQWVTSLEYHLREGQRVRVKVREMGPDGSPRLSMIGIEQSNLSRGPAPVQTDSLSFKFDPPCESALLARIVADVGSRAVENMVVAVPYAKVLSAAGIEPTRPEKWWTVAGPGSALQSAAHALEIPLGPTGAQKLQRLVLGKGTAHHVLIAGRTGSGKSNLLHVIITTLALKYSPSEVELFLVDFKKGVEFKVYANHRLPHANVIAIESEREFGLSVLRGLDTRMQARGEAFRRVEANDIAEFRQKSGDEVPRIVLIVDEFHEFFSIDDAVATEAASLLDRLVRQGRSFGIHVILGSQSLAGASMLSRSTLDQMQIRIALPCSAADSRLILADDNDSARLLSRPGEAIYNAASGLEEGNQFFQVALFDDEVWDKLLGELEHLAPVDRRPIVFEGHDPADLMFCEPLKALLRTGSAPVSIKSVPVWVGEPITLEPSVELRFRRQSGANAVVVTRDEEQAMGVMTACLLSMASGVPPGGARFTVIDLSTADAPWAGLCEDMAGALPHQVEIVQRRDIPHRLRQLCDEISRRSSDDAMAGHWTNFLIIFGLHRARDLRVDDGSTSSFDSSRDGPSPIESLSTILREGPESGIHTLVWCDNYPNLVRAIDTRGLREFGYRIAGSMSQDESMRLLDDVKASLLDRPHRMVFYDDSSAGSGRVFRPYQLPTPQWLQTVASGLRHRYEREKRG